MGSTPGVLQPQARPHPGQPPLSGRRVGGSEPRWRLRRVGQGSVGYTSPPPPQPCTWQPPASRFSSPAIPRPPSLRPPHRKLFLINENGKLGPHITSRDVLGSRSHGSRSGSTTWGASGPGLAGSFPFLLWPRGAQRAPRPLETRAGGAQVRRPRPRRRRPWAASVNSLRHLAAASGSAARGSLGVRPVSPAARRPREASFGLSGRGEWGTRHSQRGYRFCPFSSLDCPVLILGSCLLPGARLRILGIQASGRCPWAATQDRCNPEIQGPGSCRAWSHHAFHMYIWRFSVYHTVTSHPL